MNRTARHDLRIPQANPEPWPALIRKAIRCHIQSEINEIGVDLIIARRVWQDPTLRPFVEGAALVPFLLAKRQEVVDQQSAIELARAWIENGVAARLVASKEIEPPPIVEVGL